VIGVSTAAAALAVALLLLPATARGRLVSAGLAPPRRVIKHRFFSVEVCGLAIVVVFAAAASAPLALAALAIGSTVLVRRRRRREQRRLAEECRALESALDVLVGELRAGAHPVEAFRIAAMETDGRVAASFHAVAARAILGADVAAGLRAGGADSARPAHWERLAVYWELAQSHGLAIATLMRAAQSDIVERVRFGARVSAGMAGARATATMLAGLPFVGVALGELIGAQPIRFLIGSGAWLMLAGAVLACVGLLWSDRIIGRATP
jgi:tight adherence protein B